MRRRELLELMGLSAVSPILSESAAAQEVAQAAALREQLFDANQILAIDCHCHLFNATDLQVNGLELRLG